MFWIGLIVGMLIMVALAIGVVKYVMYVANVGHDDIIMMGEVCAQACNNRESKVQVWHDDECLCEAVFEEN